MTPLLRWDGLITGYELQPDAEPNRVAPVAPACPGCRAKDEALKAQNIELSRAHARILAQQQEIQEHLEAADALVRPEDIPGA